MTFLRQVAFLLTRNKMNGERGVQQQEQNLPTEADYSRNSRFIAMTFMLVKYSRFHLHFER